MHESEPSIGFRSPRLAPLRDEIEQLAGLRPVTLPAAGRAPVAAYAGWGNEADNLELRKEATQAGRPFVTFEEGLVVYPTPGRAGQPLSMVMDRGGIYYDPAGTSDLFAVLREPHWATAAVQQRAADGIALLRRHALSKFNSAAREADFRPPPGRALVIDQLSEDASLRAGAGTARDFSAMLTAATESHGGDNVVVMLHPAAIAGERNGHLHELARARGTRVIDQPVNPWRAIEPYDDVYVVSSRLGMEALCLEKRVHCFGMPFYGGFGLTDDRRAYSDPRPRIGLQTLFAAFHFGYARYFSPYKRGIVNFEDGIAAIAELTERHGEFGEPAIAFGISGWKRPTLSHFLAGARKPPEFRRQFGRRPPQPRYDGRRSYVWAAKIDIGRLNERPLDQRPMLVEDGFIRSVGLGAAGTAPLSLVFDPIGIYFDATRQSKLEKILAEAEFSPHLLERAAALREHLVSGRISKYNVGSHGALDVGGHDRVILVPGQVENDMSIKFGCDAIRGNLALLEAVRAAAPDAFIIYKPHPDVENGYRRGAVRRRQALKFADRIVNNMSVVDLFELITNVHTMTSLSGFEALLRGRKVTTYGRPFYAGWGLTEDRGSFPRRQRRLTLDQLVAGALILYPRYLHPRSGYLCDPEHVLDAIVPQARSAARALTAADRLKSWARSLILPYIS